MATSTKWAVAGGVAIVLAALAGTAAWRRAHPEADTPLAALDPLVKQLAPAPKPAGPAPASTSPASTPPGSTSGAPPTSADASAVGARGPKPPSAPNPTDDPTPTFDVVRVEPTGEAVVAGKGKPDSDVALLASGKVVAQARTDANGQFVMTPPPLKPGAYDLSLQQSAPGQPAKASRQAVTVAVPEKGQGQVVVALAEPGRPTKLLAAPAPEPPTAPNPPDSASAAGRPDAAAQLGIRTVELENATGFYVTGTAPAGTQLRVYLNDSHLTDLTSGKDGAWTLRIRKGLTGGRYIVRADALGPDGKRVIARVEVPFDVPTSVAQGAPATTPPATARASAGGASLSAPTTSPSPAASSPGTPPADQAAPPPGIAARSEAPGAVASTTPDRPAAPTSSPGPDVGAPQATPPDDTNRTASGSDAVIESVETALVARGDNLWNISRVRLGQGVRYTRIYTANANQIRDPNLIYPGQVFVVPKD